MSLHSIPQPHAHPGLISATQPARATRPRGAHRRPAAMPDLGPRFHLLTLALGAVLAAAIYTIGGPW